MMPVTLDGTNVQLRKPRTGRQRDTRLSQGLSGMAILTVVGLIAAFQFADWMLGRSQKSGRLKIV